MCVLVEEARIQGRRKILSFGRTCEDVRDRRHPESKGNRGTPSVSSETTLENTKKGEWKSWAHHLLYRGLEACGMDEEKAIMLTAAEKHICGIFFLFGITQIVFFVVKKRGPWQDIKSWVSILSQCRRNNKTMSHSHPPLLLRYFVLRMSFLPSC